MEPVGSLLQESGAPLVRMWRVFVPPGARPLRSHSHTAFEIARVESGSGVYTTPTGVWPMEIGDLFVFSSNEQHCITGAGENGLSIVNLQFEPRYLREVYTKSLQDFCFSHGPAFQSRIPGENAALLRQRHDSICREFTEAGEAYPVAVRAWLQLMLLELLRSHNYGHGETGAGRVLPGMLRVYDYIDAHLTEPLTLGELAALAGLSPNYFSQMFHKLGGVSLWDYITARRIERAAELLSGGDGSETILGIALQCGFRNTVNFNKAFKKHTGLTPSQLRKNPELWMRD